MSQLLAPQTRVDRALHRAQPQQGQHRDHRLGMIGRHVPDHLTRSHSGGDQPTGQALSSRDQLSPGPELAVEVEHYPVRVLPGPGLAQRPQILVFDAGHDLPPTVTQVTGLELAAETPV